MITLPLFHSELPAVPKVPEHLMCPKTWSASSEALPVDGVSVLCFLPCKQIRRDYPMIYSLYIRDGQWIVDDSEWLDEQWFPIEAVTHWSAIETTPLENDPRWNTDVTVRDEVVGSVWIWNDKKKRVYQYWCEGSVGNEIEHCLYYGSAGDPMLHDEFVTKWMKCAQPEDPEQHFVEHFPPSTWQSVRRLPKWLQCVHEHNIAQQSYSRLSWRSKQLNLDFSC